MTGPANEEQERLLETSAPERRAIEYLAREVPLWSKDNRCFSCHNNGDGARALYTALGRAYVVASDALADTTDWLVQPERWDHNGGEGPFSDKRLARLQFAAALTTAIQAGVVQDRESLLLAARLIAGQQDEDGSWMTDATETVGSPATYGRPLATYLARETLRVADAPAYEREIGKANRWLMSLPIQNVPEAATTLLAFATNDDPRTGSLRHRAIELVRKAQSRGGGWGPYANAPAEVFDTALVLLALAPDAEKPEIKAMVERGRGYLVEHQLSDGSWPETTRPPGGESYAQRLSTAAWATMALMMTRPQPEVRTRTPLQN